MGPLSHVGRAYRRAFAGLPRGVWLLSVVTLVHRSGTMVLPFLSLYATTVMGMSAFQAGRLLAFYGLGAVAGAALGGRLSDHLGSTRAQGLSLTAAGFSFWILGLARTPDQLILATVLTSLTAESFRPPNAAATAEMSPAPVLYRAFALRRLAINLGMTLGPAAGGFLATYDYQWLFRINGVACFAAAALLLWFFRTGTGHASVDADAAGGVNDARRHTSVWRDRPYLLLLLGVTLLMTVFFQVLGTYPLSLHDDYAFEERTIGLLFAVNTLVIVVFEMVLMVVVERFSPLRIIALGSFLICCGLGLLPWGSGIFYVIATIVIWTFGEMLSFPLLEGLVGGHAPAGQRGRYMGLYAATFSVAFVLAPVLGTWLYDGWSSRVLWLSCGLLGLVLPFFFLALERLFPESRPS